MEKKFTEEKKTTEDWMECAVLTRASASRFCKAVLRQYDAMRAMNTATQCSHDVFNALQDDVKRFLSKRIWNAAEVARKVRRASTLRASDFKVPGSDDAIA